MATRSPIRRSSRAFRTKSWNRCSAAMAMSRISSRAPIPTAMHQAMAATLETLRSGNSRDSAAGRAHAARSERPRWPMIVLRSPKGWTGPKEVDGHKVEGFWRAHQVPVADVQRIRRTCSIVEEWLRELQAGGTVRRSGTLIAELQELAPTGDRRMSANPHANGGLLRKPLRPAGFPELRGRRRSSRAQNYVSPTAALGDVPARRDAAQHDELPRVRPRRNRVEQAGRHLRGDARRPGWRNTCPKTPTAANSRRTAG